MRCLRFLWKIELAWVAWMTRNFARDVVLEFWEVVDGTLDREEGLKA